VQKKVIVRNVGYCPEQEDQTSIQITFAEVKALGFSGYKKVSFHCEHLADNGCTHCGESGSECPLFASASYP